MVMFSYYLLGGDYAAPSGLYASLCHAFLVYGLFCGLQICQKYIGGRGSALDPTGGVHELPRPLSRLGRGTPVPMPHPLGASTLAP